MYDMRLTENEKQRRDLIDRLQKRKRKPGSDDTDPTDIDELLRQARALLDDHGLKNQRLSEIRQQNEDLLEKIKRRNRQR